MASILETDECIGRNTRAQKRKMSNKSRCWKRNARRNALMLKEKADSDKSSPCSPVANSDHSEEWDWFGDCEYTGGCTLDVPKLAPGSQSSGIEATHNSTENSSIKTKIPKKFLPSEWLSETLPKKTPYYPQIGDEVMFFKQGYDLYLNTVENRNIFKLDAHETNPWSQIELDEPQLCRIIQIRYEIRPPRICHLRLAVMTDEHDQPTSLNFDITYLDIPDVVDFLVLSQIYDRAIARQWKIGDRFKNAVNDVWWAGEIINRIRRTKSLFRCFKIRWDCGECDNISPWDMEPLTSQREPRVGQLMKILPHELKKILYHPLERDWPADDQDTSCKRILCSLKELMSMSLAQQFLTPVDISSYPSYAKVIAYPIDLSTIKERFENRFYRRIASAEFDVRFIASNAEKYNERDSQIVKNAYVITDILLQIMKATLPLDIPALCKELEDFYTEGTQSSAELSNRRLPSTSKQSTPIEPKLSSVNTTNSQSELEKETNAETQFLSSILPDFKKLNYRDNLDFRIHVLNFFREKRNSTR